MISEIFHIPYLWNFFWSMYFLIAIRRHRFSQNFFEAWRLKYPDHVITIFIDRSHCIHIPCPAPDAPEVNDAWLWDHISFFYRLSRIQGGILQAMLPKSLVNIEIVQVSYMLIRVICVDYKLDIWHEIL
jgi:hypothetical protein